MIKKSILMIADPTIPVPPVTYGGVERIIDILVEGLVERGWNVTLAAHPDSSCNARLLPHKSYSYRRVGRIVNSWNLLKHVAGNQYDLVHSSAHYDLASPLWPLSQKVIQTFHAPPDWNAFNKRVRLIPKRNLWFTTVGLHMVKSFNEIAPCYGIHNAVRIEEFDFREHIPEEAPLVFLGRIEKIKGPHTAIQIAKATGKNLVIAGNRSRSVEIERYFSEEIEPHLSDQIRYIGQVDTAQRNQLLGSAAALLMPIEWDEPFGLVMAESLACGTPVIGLSRGALPEIVNHGVTGICCSSFEEMIDAVHQIKRLHRRECRNEAEMRFAAPVMVDRYISLYESILSEQPAR
jgi:glycosyltransferase involved in cell wall biosynthesis